MRILEKYILKDFISSFLFCVVLLMVLGVIGDVLGFMDDIFKNNIPLSSILAFYAYLAPFAFVNMVPFAALLSAAYVFNSLSKNHEITAVIASGLSLWKLLRPVLLVMLLVCIAVFIVNDRVVPSTMRKAEQIRSEDLESGNKGREKVITNLAVYGKGGQIIFAKSYLPEQSTLTDVIIHKQDENHRVMKKINARQVKYQGDGVWQGSDVIMFGLDEKGDFTGDPEIYKTKDLEIRETPSELSKSQWDPKFMSYKQLKKYLSVFNVESPVAIRRLLVDLNYKLAFPFTALITVIICVPFSIETGRANALVGMVRGITIGMLYVPVMAVSLALGKAGVFPPIAAAWLSNALFAILGVYYIYKKS
ncbi:MAG: LptF/LptG family permease [Candidatus Omnitrophota bacterium]